MFQPWRKIEELKNGYDTYAASFHEVKLHLAEALQYHENLEELQKAFVKNILMIWKNSMYLKMILITQ